MKSKQSTSTYILVFFAIWVVGLLLYIPLSKGDELYYARSFRTPLLDSVMYWITKLSEEWIYIAMIVFFLFSSIKKAVITALGGLTSLGITAILKMLYEQPRPRVWLSVRYKLTEFDTISGHYIHDGFNSFPSGHTLSAFMLSAFCAHFFPRFKWIFLFLACVVGLSRIYLVQHFFDDILFGSLLGSLFGLAIITIFEDKLTSLDRGLKDLMR